MMTLIWVDDERNPKDYIDTQKYDVTWLKSYEEFTAYFETSEIPDIIWFDHDLGEGRSGYDCAVFLIETCQKYDCDLPEYYSQSSNPPGRERILGLLDSYRKFRNRDR